MPKQLKTGDLVWCHEDNLLYAPARVLSSFNAGDSGEIEIIETGERIQLHGDDTAGLIKIDKRIEEDHDNLTSLSKLNEESLLFSLRKRFKEDSIYTSIGPILVSINPFKQLPYYTQDVLDSYMDGRRTFQNAPHVFGVAARCFSQLVEHKKNQSCIVTGESGAGKTEATKLILQYLTEKSSNGEVSARDESNKLQQKILEMNPLLEAFGNARTGRNDNSSRFGKLTQLFISNSKGTISGVGIIDYLLEKSRIVQQMKGERNYHIFYQMLSDSAVLAEFDLKYPENYYYLTQWFDPEQVVVKTLNDSQDWKDTGSSMEVLGINDETKNEILGTLAGILNLGNIKFIANDDKDPASIEGGEACEWVQKAAKLFGFDQAKLVDGLLRTEITVRSETTYKNHNIQKAGDARDALAKSIYSALFQYLIDKINAVVENTENSSFLTINVLDIFGFEQFQFNSFEQLCINYCNEKLQVHFIDNVFKVEQKAYLEEGIEVKEIDFEDNSEVLQIIEDRGKGIYSLLDEQNKLPTGSDEMFLKKVLTQAKDFTNLSAPKISDVRRNSFMELNFNIRHFAGEVSYNVTNFLEKNSDKLLTSLEGVANSTSKPFVKDLFTKYVQRGKGSTSLGVKFKNQLNSLLTVLNTSEPHFVRTIKPNPEKVKESFNSQMVLDQIKCAGLLGVCEIHKNGYPVKFEFSDFMHRYNMIVNNSARDVHDLGSMLEQEGLAISGEWQIGKSKFFMRNQMYEGLEMAREENLAVYVVVIQKNIRRYLMMKKFYKVKRCLLDLSDAMKANDEDLIRALLEEAATLPKVGQFLNLIIDAKNLLQKIGAANNALADLRQAVKDRDGNVAASILNSLDGMDLTGIKRQSVIFEAESLLEELQKQSALDEFEYNFQNGDIEEFMHQMWEKMGGAFGINAKDVDQLKNLKDQIEQGLLDIEDQEEALAKASRLLDYADLQLEIQDLVSIALDSQDPESLQEALQFIQQFNLQTNDAKRVINLTLADEYKKQDQAIVSMRMQPLSMKLNALNIGGNGGGERGASKKMKPTGLQGPGGNPRMSAMVDMTANRISFTGTGMYTNDTTMRVSAKLRSMGGEEMVKKYNPSAFYQLRPDEDYFTGPSDKEKLEWTGKVIPKSLTVLNDELNKTAVQINKSVLQYAGDESFQYPSTAALSIIKNGLEVPILSNEIYLQLMKQLSSNTRPTSEDRSWVLMVLITQHIAPTPELQGYLFGFFDKFKDVPLLIGNYARLSAAQLVRTMDLGSSNLGDLPDIDMVTAYTSRPAVLISLETCSPDYNSTGSDKNTRTIDLPCYPENDAQEFVEKACEIAEIEQGEAERYGLFIVSSVIKYQSDFAERLERFYQQWDPEKLKHIDYFAAVYDGREEALFEQLTKRYGEEPPKPDTNRFSKVKMEESNEDVTDENLFQPIPWWLFPGDIFRDLCFKGKQARFSLKRKLILGDEKPNPELVEQFRQQIQRGELAITEYQDITKLAAVVLNLKNGGPLSNTTEILSLGLDYIFPKIWMDVQLPKLTADDVFDESEGYRNYRPRDLCKEFIDIAKTAEGYGVWFYPTTGVETFSGNNGKEDKECEYVGVSCKGIHLFDESRTESVALYSYGEIGEYGADGDRVFLNFNEGSREEAEVTFLTSVPWELYSAIQSYLEVTQRMSKGMTRAPTTSFNRNSVFRTSKY